MDPDPLTILQQFIIPACPLSPFYLLASRLLSICVNSATCERLFSTFGTTLTKLRNRMGTSTLASLAELKMHLRSEHQRDSTKTRMKHLFDKRSRNLVPDNTPTSQPPPSNHGPEPVISPSESFASETPGLRHLVPGDAADDELDFTGTESPVPLRDLIQFNDNHWVKLYDGYARRHMEDELALCELLNQDSATDGGAEIDVDELTGEILAT